MSFGTGRLSKSCKWHYSKCPDLYLYSNAVIVYLEHDGYEHDGDLVFVSVGGQPVTRQLTDYLGSHLSSGTQRDYHLTTENRQRRHGNNKHDDGVE